MGKNFGITSEPTSNASRNGTAAIADPFLDSTLNEKASLQLSGDKPAVDLGSDIEEAEGDESIAMIGVRPTVLLDDVDSSKKKRRHHADSTTEKLNDGLAVKTPPPDLSVVPATPILAEEASVFFFFDSFSI